ncbi:MAG: glycosyltransferase [Gemmatimonadota bacterium]|nr:glycosyltransferase [Gemmatimonadota bacterium]
MSTIRATDDRAAAPETIALFVPSLNAAGAERVAVNLAHALVNAGQRVDLVVARAQGDLLNQLSPKLRLIDLGSSRVLFSLPGLAGYLRRERPVGLISFMDHANIVALLARALAGGSTRVVATVHNTLSVATSNSNNRRSKLLPLLIRAFYRMADEVVAVSQGAADDMVRTAGLAADRVSVIYNPVITPGLLAARNAPPPHPWLEPGQPPVVLGVGRLTAQKDFPNLLRAFALVRRQRPARLIILGEGPDRPELEALVSQLGLGTDAALPGYHPAVPAFMARAAVFVLSSAYEGLPTVLIEAMALTRSLVSTDCPSGPREILQHGRLGRLVPMRDPEALSQAILASLDHPGTIASDEALEPYTEKAAVENYLRAVGSSAAPTGPESGIHLNLGQTARSHGL